MAGNICYPFRYVAIISNEWERQVVALNTSNMCLCVSRYYSLCFAEKNLFSETESSLFHPRAVIYVFRGSLDVAGDGNCQISKCVISV